jgi:hypothetical protein
MTKAKINPIVVRAGDDVLVFCKINLIVAWWRDGIGGAKYQSNDSSLWATRGMRHRR